ncbi:MAG TPA: malto-oligosyltrehalose synthase [Vicinamibacterales bacterium]|nr:malto-oligosyltrehalose synthase [Vicinamibacterales bacterium]
MAPACTPESTYRLQFNKSFTFAHATAIADYLQRLGISDCYASSYLAAVPGSTHGYDVADPGRLNPEVGTEEEYWAWIEALRGCGMGHVLDLVPNHMGIAQSANPLWQDVLENGPSSRFAHFFDIDWHPVKDELADKVLIPILGDQYGAALENQELRLAFDQKTFVVRCYDNSLPVAPDTFSAIFGGAHLEAWLAAHPGADAEELQSILTASRNLPSRSSRDPEHIAVRAREKEVIKRRLGALATASPDVGRLIEASVDRFNGVSGQPRSFDELDRLLHEQSYRLAHWRVASEEINYRRFFDVNELAALRMEDPVVFEEVHRFALDLIQRGAPTGLRIDHVDGLFDPAEYLRRLQARCGEGFYIVVEKILGAGERLPEEWPVAGTTGYEFAAVVNNLFVDRRNERAFDDVAARFVRERRSRLTFQDLAYRCRKQIMHETMSGDINSLGHRLNLFSERNRHFRDFTLYSLISTLKEAIACFPVYRTYVTETEPVRDQDRQYIAEAIRSAKRRAPSIPALVFDFVERLLLKQTSVSAPDEAAERALFIGKFQQITSPVAAKGIEDTALYLFPRLLSLNEVGADPTCFGLDPSIVHDWFLRRLRDSPSGLSATSTHDSKRGEDVRARLNVLSEIPGAWTPAVLKWRSLNRRFKSEVGGISAPDPNEEYLLYQTLIGAWPFNFSLGEVRDQAEPDDFVERVSAYMVKALRESKAHTSWINPDADYERAVLRFVSALLDPRRAPAFLEAFLPFQARVAELGIYNSLAQLLIKITAPGVPDFYQGTELWDLRLVDPDNRRPVDYDFRRRMLESITTEQNGDDRAVAAQLLESRRDGRIKMFVTARALAARRRLRGVFAGEYVPLRTFGTCRDSLFAFARRSGTECAVTCVPRLLASMVPDASGSSSPPLGSVWLDTRVELPGGTASSFRDVFTGTRFDTSIEGGTTTLPAAAVFAQFPVALLVAE